MGRVSPRRQPMTAPAEPKDTLDAPAMAGVNGPEDDRPGWDWYDIDWDQANRDVRRLRQRIFAASKDGDVKGPESAEAGLAVPGKRWSACAG